MQAYERLELEWAKFNDLDPAGMVACASGTAAIHLALEALQLPQCSKVLTGDFNMIAVPRAIAAAGLTPMFVDCREDLNVDPTLLREGVNADTGAILLVSIYGRKASHGGPDGWPCPLPKNGVPIIEDLAEAHGVKPDKYTDAACWSFYKNKIVAGEEGGAVWFRNPEHAKIARELRSLGFNDAHDFMHRPRGWNHRMSDAHAELILKSLRNYHDGESGNGAGCFPGIAEERREIESWHDAECPDDWRMPKRDAVWIFDLRIRGMTTETQNLVIQDLLAVGIQARHGFKPMTLQEEFKQCRLVCADPSRESLSRVASREVIYLPTLPGVTTRESCKKAFDVIKKRLGKISL